MEQRQNEWGGLSECEEDRPTRDDRLTFMRAARKLNETAAGGASDAT